MRRFRVLKECVINHAYSAPGGVVYIQTRDEHKRFVDQLVEHGFLMEQEPPKPAVIPPLAKSIRIPISEDDVVIEIKVIHQ